VPAKNCEGGRFEGRGKDFAWKKPKSRKKKSVKRERRKAPSSKNKQGIAALQPE